MPSFAVEAVGFQQMYESLLAQKGAVIDYKASKVSNKTLKQGLLNRLRVWFERELIIFPFGDDTTRKQVNIMLNELETHAWKSGDIIDLGRHNDCVMALAHAIDQFQYRDKGMPAIFSTLNRGEWMGGSKGIQRSGGGFSGKIVRRGWSNE